MDSDDSVDDADLDSPGLYDASVDLWSLGVSMYEVSSYRSYSFRGDRV